MDCDDAEEARDLLGHENSRVMRAVDRGQAQQASGRGLLQPAGTVTLSSCKGPLVAGRMGRYVALGAPGLSGKSAFSTEFVRW
jgi:hypothetical protein